MRLDAGSSATGTTFEEATTFMKARVRELIPASLSDLKVDHETGELIFGDLRWAMTSPAAYQLASKLGITPGYVLKISNDLAATNYNAFLDEAAGRIKLGIEDGVVAAILKETTTLIDPEIVIEGSSSLEREEARLVKWSYTTGSGLILRSASDSLVLEPKVGDIVKAGVDVLAPWNDVGVGVRGTLYRLWCSNGAVSPVPFPIKKSINSSDWKTASSRVFSAVRSADELLTTSFKIGENLREMTKMDLSVPDTSEDSLSYFRAGLRVLKPKKISNPKLLETVAEEIAEEDPTMFGLYNALTRIGRDSKDPSRREFFEGAGFSLAADPQIVFSAFMELEDLMDE